MPAKPVTVAVIGAGGRGIGFGRLLASTPLWGRVVAVAEPRPEYREAFAAAHALTPDRVFRDWRELVALPKLADAVIIATMDRDHVGPAVACTALGYHMFLEKPMATTLEDCEAIAASQRKAGTITSVCHSLRYHKAFALLKDIVSSGRIGATVSVDQLEQVAWWHQAHSFVRGNWGNESRSSPMLLAKSCHDLDYIAFLVARPCRRVSSFGSLTYFTPRNAPAGSGERCVECAVEPECPYSAIRHYILGNRASWPASAIAHEHSEQAHWEAIRRGPYGRCVWKTDNDVVDHQVVAMEFDGQVTATFTMTAFTQRGGRKIRVHGTEGEVEFTDEWLELRTFRDNSTQRIVPGSEPGGHGGGDHRVLLSFLRAVAAGDPSLVTSDVQESLATHRIVFAAERSRREGRTVELGSAAQER